MFIEFKRGFKREKREDGTGRGGSCWMCGVQARANVRFFFSFFFCHDAL